MNRCCRQPPDIVKGLSREGSAWPPLEWLRVFEAAAGTGSFTTAAEELGPTQAAISQHIRSLKARLETAPFVRQARGVELTTEG